MRSAAQVFTARRIITMNPSVPYATHVAVRDGRILGYGAADDVAAFGPAELDARFADEVIMLGFVEGHSHAFEGMTWLDPYLGYFDRRGPDGRVWPGLKGIEAVVQRLREAEGALDDPAAPVTAWGFDPIYFGGPRMVRADLDRVSVTRPVVVTHASGHIMNVNGVALHQAGFTQSTDLDGLVRDADGALTGELLGPEAMGRVRRVVGGASMERVLDVPGLRRFAGLAQAAGVTTAADLLNDLTPETVASYHMGRGSDSGYTRNVESLDWRGSGHFRCHP